MASYRRFSPAVSACGGCQVYAYGVAEKRAVGSATVAAQLGGHGGHGGHALMSCPAGTVPCPV